MSKQLGRKEKNEKIKLEKFLLCRRHMSTSTPIIRNLRWGKNN
jgi:hypothetical protein